MAKRLRTLIVAVLVLAALGSGTVSERQDPRAGIDVASGEQVGIGRQIGNRGRSGTTMAHLPFGVSRTWPVQHGDDVPVNVRNAAGPLDSRGGPQAGVTDTALPS